MKRTICFLLVMVLCVSMLFGCSNTQQPSGGTTTDAGTKTDAGTQPDAGTPTTSGTDAGSSTGETIYIGVFEPMTGGNAAAGQLEFEGMQAANKAVPEVLGKKIELFVADNKTDDVEAVTAAASIVSKGCVAALGGSGSGFCIAAGPTFEAAKIPVIGTTCTNPLVTEGNDYYFRICYTDDFQGVILANYAKNQLGAKNAAVICDVTDTYCIGLRDVFVKSFGEEGIVADVYFNKGDQDFSAQLTTVMQAKPDVVFLPSQYTEAALVQVQAKQMGFETIFLGADAWEADVFIEIGGDAVEGCRFTCFYDDTATPTEYSEKYLADYAAMFDGSRPKSAFTALGYDAYMVAVQAMEACGSTDGAAIRQAILDMKYAGVTGEFGFAANGDADKNSAYIKTVEDGKFKFMEIATMD